MRGCLGARKERAFKDYVRDVAALVDESNQQSTQLFDLLNGRRGRATRSTVQNALNGFRVQAAQLVDRAEAPRHARRGRGAPSDYLLEVLEFRRDGLAAIATQLPPRSATRVAARARENIALAMRNFLTSDVLFRRASRPRLKATPSTKDDLSVQLPRSGFLRDTTGSTRASSPTRSTRSARAAAAADEEAAPGLHGNGLVRRQPRRQTLTPGGSATVTLSDDIAFEVQVANQGENTETDVNVKVRSAAATTRSSSRSRSTRSPPARPRPVTIPLGEQPPTGQSVPVEVEVEAVPGEQKTDNNTATYSVIFTR